MGGLEFIGGFFDFLLDGFLLFVQSLVEALGLALEFFLSGDAGGVGCESGIGATIPPVLPKLGESHPKLERLNVGQVVQAGEQQGEINDDGSGSAERVKNRIDGYVRDNTTEMKPFRPKIEIEVDVQLLQQPHQGQRVHQRGDWFLPGISEIREKWMEESQPEYQQQKRHHVSREPDADKRNIREISPDRADHVMIAIGRVAGV